MKKITSLMDELKTMDEELLNSHENFEVSPCKLYLIVGQFPEVLAQATGIVISCQAYGNYLTRKLN